MAKRPVDIYDIDDLIEDDYDDAPDESANYPEYDRDDDRADYRDDYEERPRARRDYEERSYNRRPARQTRTRDRYEDYDDYEDERPRKKSGILTYIIPIAAFLVLVVALGLFAKEWLTYKAAGDEYKLIKEKIIIPDEPEVVAEDGMTYPDLDIDFEALLATNPEFVCVIYIPALDLYYPVAQSENNEKYLTTTFEGTTNPSGCIFLDANASPDFTDMNTFIYGHNMKNETMFGSLKLFSTDNDICAAHPYIYLYLADGSVLKYHIFSYYTTPVNDAVYNGISTEREYDSYVIRAQSRSYYEQTEEEKDDFEARPNLLTLSTCWGNDHKNNFVVHGALLGKADTAVQLTDETTESAEETAATLE